MQEEIIADVRKKEEERSVCTCIIYGPRMVRVMHLSHVGGAEEQSIMCAIPFSPRCECYPVNSCHLSYEVVFV